jgi:heat-inducible transcriptional repressor
MGTSELSGRSRRILATLVREYIETGEPISSHVLVERGAFGLSSATLRNALALLEQQGYLSQPHTSAGRVPTDAGYRCYVDMLLESRRPARPRAVEAQLRARAGEAALLEEVLAEVPHVLSLAAHSVGFALGPTSEAEAFQQIDFVPLAGSKVLVVVVAHGGRVTNKVIDTGEAMDLVDLRQAANYLNAEFAGLTLAEVRARVLERLAQERSLYDALLSRALRLARSALESVGPDHTIFVEGAASLLEAAAGPSGGVSLPTLRALLRMVEEKHRLVRLLTEYIEGPGLTVVIGTEHSLPDLHGFSLIASTYGDGQRTGTIGIIGPTRMRYSRAISAVDCVARAVSHLLAEGTWDATAIRC